MLKKKKPEIPRILAQSPEEPVVEVQKDVKILEQAQPALDETSINNHNSSELIGIKPQENLDDASSRYNIKEEQKIEAQDKESESNKGLKKV